MDTNPNLEIRGAERPPTYASPVELNRHVEAARVLRAQVTAAMLGGTFSALARPLRGLVAGAARWRRQRATEAALTRCSDRVLADIGFAREEIPLIARGLEPSQEPEADAGWRRWPAMLAHVEVLAMIRRGASHGWLRRHPQTLADRA